MKTSLSIRERIHLAGLIVAYLASNFGKLRFTLVGTYLTGEMIFLTVNHFGVKHFDLIACLDFIIFRLIALLIAIACFSSIEKRQTKFNQFIWSWFGFIFVGWIVCILLYEVQLNLMAAVILFAATSPSTCVVLAALFFVRSIIEWILRSCH